MNKGCFRYKYILLGKHYIVTNEKKKLMYLTEITISNCQPCRIVANLNHVILQQSNRCAVNRTSQFRKNRIHGKITIISVSYISYIGFKIKQFYRCKTYFVQDLRCLKLICQLYPRVSIYHKVLKLIIVYYLLILYLPPT